MAKRVRGYWLNKCGRIHIIPSFALTLEGSYEDENSPFSPVTVLSVEICWWTRWSAVEVVLWKKEVSNG
jgi:hypothetical protein